MKKALPLAELFCGAPPGVFPCFDPRVSNSTPHTERCYGEAFVNIRLKVRSINCPLCADSFHCRKGITTSRIGPLPLVKLLLLFESLGGRGALGATN